MVTRTGRKRRKSRHKFKITVKEKGRINISRHLQEFNQGDIIILNATPSVQKGLYHSRFHGKHGVIKGKRGNSYELIIKDRKKEKLLIVNPVHLKKA